MNKRLLCLLGGILTLASTGCSKNPGANDLMNEPIREIDNAFQAEFNDASSRCSKDWEGVASTDLTGDGHFLQYEENIVNKGYNSSIIYYPEVNSSVPYPVVVIMHGYKGQKEKLAFIGQKLAQKGFASFVITAINSDEVFTRPTDWIYNYEAAFESIIAENESPESPLYHKMDMARISIVGHSMGAGGAIFFADQQSLKYKIKSIVAMAPYSLKAQKPGHNITIPTLIMAGGKDHLALPSMTKKFYQALSSSEKNYFFDKNATHIDFESKMIENPQITSEILNWLETYGK